MRSASLVVLTAILAGCVPSDPVGVNVAGQKQNGPPVQAAAVLVPENKEPIDTMDLYKAFGNPAAGNLAYKGKTLAVFAHWAQVEQEDGRYTVSAFSHFDESKERQYRVRMTFENTPDEEFAAVRGGLISVVGVCDGLKSHNFQTVLAFSRCRFVR